MDEPTAESVGKRDTRLKTVGIRTKMDNLAHTHPNFSIDAAHVTVSTLIEYYGIL